MKTLLLVISIALLTGGCANTLSDNVTTKLFDASQNVVAELSGTAVQRDVVYANAHVNRDALTKEMYLKSGAEVVMGEFQEITPGVFVQPIKSIVVRESPRFQQNLETRPPDHRGWKTADNIVDKVFWGFLGSKAFDSYDSKDTTSYAGDATFHSYNPVTTTEAYVPTL